MSRVKVLNKITNLALDEDTKARLNKAAERCNTPASNLIRKGIQWILEDIESGHYFDRLKESK